MKVLTKDIAREVNVVINLACDPSVLIGRISGRRVCKKCGNSYHIETKKPLVEGVCDACGEPLIQRPDDTEEALKVRLDAYENQTKPLIEFYKNEGLLKEVDGLQGINDVFGDIKNILEGKKLPVYGKGENVRDWLYVEDHAKAIDMVLNSGRVGEVYNIGGFNEEQNINIVKKYLP